jgi:AraC family transcriptional regulator
MIDRVIYMDEKKLAGHRLPMSFSANRTAELWQKFMKQRKEITGAINSDLISMQIFPTDFNFANPDFSAVFIKWAAVEVNDFTEIPVDMETCIIPAGRYAVFHYQGHPGAAIPYFAEIFCKWLPEAGLSVDQRPHFEILGEKYKNNSPDSEEDIYIPVV